MIRRIDAAVERDGRDSVPFKTHVIAGPGAEAVHLDAHPLRGLQRRVDGAAIPAGGIPRHPPPPPAPPVRGGFPTISRSPQPTMSRLIIAPTPCRRSFANAADPKSPSSSPENGTNR